ncbi:hypothetical protein JXL83_01100 [candidate division WOR-3 bacterium]|nr:hypothetical protein [candidate division WOR-3 bacterium]
MMKWSIFILIIAIFLFPGSENCYCQFEIDFETGFAFTGYNDVRIPGTTGTLFSLKDDLSPDAVFFVRGRFSKSFGNRHLVSVLAAPLRIKSRGILSRDIFFEGILFESDDNVTADYRFDSYRFTYRYMFYDRGRFSAGAGITGKIRDAEIRLTNGLTTTSKKNTGFVPLVNFNIQYLLTNGFSLLLDGDALAAPQGRAEDIFVGAVYSVNPDIGLKAGYRILEGGADNDEVYSFALVNYISAGVIIRI